MGITGKRLDRRCQLQRLSILHVSALTPYNFLKIAYWLSCYPLGISVYIRILFFYLTYFHRRRKISDTAPFNTPDWYTSAVYRTGAEDHR